MVDAENLPYKTQLLYNFRKKADGTYNYKMNDLDIHVFADEVDHRYVNWEKIKSSSKYKYGVVWMALNSEHCYDNKILIKRLESHFQEINLDFVLRNARLVSQFVRTS